MSQPPTYVRQTDFSEDERANVGGRSTVRTDKLDAELDALGLTANSAAANLGLIQRDDGALRDQVVTPESLSPSTALMIGGAGFRPRGMYAVGQSYAVRDQVETPSGVYVCLQAISVATDFTAERAANKWMAFAASPDATITAQTLPFGPVGGIAGTNAQAAIVETHDLASQAKATADQALASAGSGTGGGTGGTTTIPPFAVAALVAATSASNRVNADTRDPTPPPKAPTPSLTAGVGQIEVSWVKASYAVGHGPGRVLVFAAEWADLTTTTAPAFTAAKALGGVQEVAERTAILWNPNKKVRVWLQFESFDAYLGPVGDPADVVTVPIPQTALGQLQFDANMISASLEMGLLVSDPSFASGAAVWSNFVQRLGGGTSGVPAGCPVEYAAQFKGRDCVSSRSLSVRAGDQYLVSAFANAVATGLRVGVVAYFDFVDGRPTASDPLEVSLPANAWQKVAKTITVPAGAVRMRVGPHIDQGHTGTALCWFGDMRAAKVTEGDEIRQGSLTAATIAANTITTEKLVVGAATDHLVATSGTFSFVVPTGGASTSTTGGQRFGKARLPKQVSRGLVVVQAQFDCEIDSNLASTIQDLKFFELDMAVAVLRADGSVVAQKLAREAPIVNPYRGAAATSGVCSITRSFVLYIDEAAKFDADIGMGVVFAGRGSDGDFFRPLVNGTRTDALFCNVQFDVTFVENKV